MTLQEAAHTDDSAVLGLGSSATLNIEPRDASCEPDGAVAPTRPPAGSRAAALAAGHEHDQHAGSRDRAESTRLRTVTLIDNPDQIRKEMMQGHARHWWGRKPRMRQEWGEHQEHLKMSWDELFIDLMFVAGVIRLGSFLKSEFKVDQWGAVAEAALLMWGFFWLWLEMVLIDTRFKISGLWRECMLWWYLSSLLFYGLHVENGSGDPNGLTLAFLSALTNLIVWYAIIYRNVQRARFFSAREIGGYVFAGAMWAISALVPAPGKYALWCVALATRTVMFVIIRITKDQRVPVNVDHLAERYGLFVMLVMGESVISLISIPLPPNNDMNFFGTAALGFALVHLLHLLYFKSQPHEPDAHALRRSSLAGVLFSIIHIPLAVGLFFVGVALKILLSGYTTTVVPSKNAWLFCGSLALVHVCINAIRLSHPFAKRPPVIWALRGATLVAILVMPLFASSLSPVGICGLAVALHFALYMADISGSARAKWLARHRIAKHTRKRLQHRLKHFGAKVRKYGTPRAKAEKKGKKGALDIQQQQQPDPAITTS